MLINCQMVSRFRINIIYAFLIVNVLIWERNKDGKQEWKSELGQERKNQTNNIKIWNPWIASKDLPIHLQTQKNKS